MSNSRLATWMIHYLYFLPVVKRVVRRWARRHPSGTIVEIPCGELRGLRWRVDSAYVSSLWLGIYELAVQNVLVSRLQPGMVFYDIGANSGVFSLLAAHLVGDQGRVLAFEPDRHCRQVLNDTIAINQLDMVRVMAEAVSDRCGKATLVTGPGSTTSYLSEEAPDSNQGCLVELTTLDDLLGNKDIPPPDLLKVDVEGAETLVLRGSGTILEEKRPVWIIETHGEAKRQDVLAILDRFDYACSAIKELSLVKRSNVHLLAVPR